MCSYYLCYCCIHSNSNNRYCENCEKGNKFKGLETKKEKTHIEKVIYNPPATIVFWSDDDKTIVKCSKNDTFDPEKGLAMAICKKSCSENNYYKEIKKWANTYERNLTV